MSAAVSPSPSAAQDADQEGDLVPGAGEVITVARPTWDTGWFQAEIVTQLLAELGYVIDGPSTYTNDDFYTDVQSGEVDLWVNGWFPLHEQLLATNATGATVGRGRGGGRSAPGLLRDTVEQISADYGPLMEAAVLRRAAGEPVLYYTFTPNWTTGVLVPGSDVVWIPTPFPSLPADIAGQESATVIDDIDGCLADPCAMGFPPNDIRSVANRELLDREPRSQHCSNR